MAADHDVVEDVTPSGAPHVADGRSTGQLLGDIVGELRTIARKEAELATQELREAVMVRGQVAIAAAVAGILGLVALGCLVTAAAAGLSLAMPRWAAWAVVAAVLLLLAGVALLVARSRLRAVPLAPETTRQSIEENVLWARTQLRR